MCSRSSVHKAMVILKLVTWLDCISLEKVGSGSPVTQQYVERAVVPALPVMNMVLMPLKSGTVAMDQSSRFTLVENSWVKQSVIGTTLCCSTSKL